MSEKLRIGVVGGGSWATALVKILSDNALPKDIHWWVRHTTKAEYIRMHRHNPDYLQSVEIHPHCVQIHSRLPEMMPHCEAVILAIPSAYIHQTLSKEVLEQLPGKKIISAIKGMIPETRQILGDYLQEQGVARERIAVLTGPCHAEEVAMEKLSYLTLASENADLRNLACHLVQNEYIRTTPSDDIYGTEYSAVLKNIYAIAAGICHGAGMGDNFQAVLVSNAIREIKRFIAAVHPIYRDIDDSAYLGDLLVTAYSTFSRNRTFGNMLGKGYSVKNAQAEMNMVAEGYYATEPIYEMNRSLELHMPILDLVYSVIFRQQNPRKCIEILVQKLN